MIAQSSSSLVPSAGVVEEGELEESSFIVSKTFSCRRLSRENSSVKKAATAIPPTIYPTTGPVASELLELRLVSSDAETGGLVVEAVGDETGVLPAVRFDTLVIPQGSAPFK